MGPGLSVAVPRSRTGSRATQAVGSGEKRDNRWQRACMPEDQVKPHLILRFWIFRGSQTQFPQKSTNLGTGTASFKIANSKPVEETE